VGPFGLVGVSTTSLEGAHLVVVDLVVHLVAQRVGNFSDRPWGISVILVTCKYRKEVAADESRKAGEQDWILAGFRVTSVFDISQTEGTPLPDAAMPVLLEGEAPVGMWEAIKSLIEKEGFSVARVNCGSANGTTSYLDRTVTVAPHLSPLASVKTLVHELAHVRMHGDRHSPEMRALCEIEAESVSYIVMQSPPWECNSSVYALPYVARWAEGDLNLVKTTAQRVVSEAHRIISECESLIE
jgi:hypothetical protein